MYSSNHRNNYYINYNSPSVKSTSFFLSFPSIPLKMLKINNRKKNSTKLIVAFWIVFTGSFCIFISTRVHYYHKRTQQKKIIFNINLLYIEHVFPCYIPSNNYTLRSCCNFTISLFFVFFVVGLVLYRFIEFQ